jgi:hypothetical protein
MREIFKDVLSREGVKGLMVFSFAGDPVYKEFNQAQPEGIGSRDWRLFIESLSGMREIDLIFKKGRLYIRRTDIGYLVILMGLFVPIAMMRLQCDILLPSLKPAKVTKGIRRLFKK